MEARRLTVEVVSSGGWDSGWRNVTRKVSLHLGGVEPEDTTQPKLMGRKSVLLAELWRTPCSFPEQCLSKPQRWGSFNLWEQACSSFHGSSDDKQSAHSRRPGSNP